MPQRCRMLFFFLFCVLFPPATAPAKTLTIPGDADSIQEAVEKAESGDEIVVGTEEVKWTKTVDTYYNIPRGDPAGVRIQDKKLVLRGNLSSPSRIVSHSSFPSYNSTNSALWIENSQVTLRNLALEKPILSRYPDGFPATGGAIAAPFHVESGTLTVQNCHIVTPIESKGDLVIESTLIQGYSWLAGYGYTQLSLMTPSIQFGPAVGAHLIVKDSTVTSDTATAYINLLVENVRQCRIEFRNSRFLGGTYDVGYGSYPYPPGSDGVTVKDCTDVVLHIENCGFDGGGGYDAMSHRHGVITDAGVGGAGLAVVDSSVMFTAEGMNGQAAGGDGGTAFLSLDYNDYSIVKRSAAPGGPGLRVQKAKIHTISGDLQSLFESRGGLGGGSALYQEPSIPNGLFMPSGSEGAPLQIDGDSSVEPISGTAN